jgi:hypothetical protein
MINLRLFVFRRHIGVEPSDLFLVRMWEERLEGFCSQDRIMDVIKENQGLLWC